MTTELLTASQWQRAGRIITKGQHARYYRVSDDRTQGRAVFSFDQTSPAGAPDDADSWTVVIDASEWEQIKAQRKAVQHQPHVKVRKPQNGGAEVWCGPDPDIIALLQSYGYHYNPGTRYWYHPNKDAEQIADAFANGKVRGMRIRVKRAWEVPEGLVI